MEVSAPFEWDARGGAARGTEQPYYVGWHVRWRESSYGSVVRWQARQGVDCWGCWVCRRVFTDVGRLQDHFVQRHNRGRRGGPAYFAGRGGWFSGNAFVMHPDRPIAAWHGAVPKNQRRY